MTLLVGSTVKLSLVILAGLAFATVLRRRSAAIRHWILAVTILCAMAMPFLELVVPGWRIDVGRARRQAVVAGGTPSAAAAPIPASSTPVLAVASAAPTTAARMMRVAWLAWVAGTSISLFVLAAGLVRLAWLAAHARRLSHGRWREIADEMRRDCGLRQQVVLLQSGHPSLLATWGVVRPRILLPRAAAGWKADRIRIVLRHELAHVRRRDWLLQMAGELLRCACWFNPLVWIACARLRQESEQACDDEVLRGGVDGSAYATELLQLARALKPAVSPYSPTLAIVRPSGLERRIRAMLNARLTRAPLTRPVRLGTAALLLAFGVGVAAAQSGPVTLSGTVLDPTGAPVPGAAVLLTNARTQARFEVVSSPAGHFEFVPLPADDYLLEGKYPGLSKREERVTLDGSTVRRDLTLPLGTLRETVSVSGTPTLAKASGVMDGDGREGFRRDLASCSSAATGGRVRPPRKIRNVSPVYPAHLREAGVTGHVVLRGTVGTDGTFRDLQVVTSAQPELDAAALDAVRQWQFDGALLNCTPVEIELMAAVDFSGR